MSLLYAGGLWTIAVIAALMAGYIWALGWPRWANWVLLAAAVLVVILSQFLPATHLFNVSVAEGLHWWRWALTIAAPVLAYALVIRWIKRKVDARHDS